jgi:hypothetical protein
LTNLRSDRKLILSLSNSALFSLEIEVLLVKNATNVFGHEVTNRGKPLRQSLSLVVKTMKQALRHRLKPRRFCGWDTGEIIAIAAL